MYLVVPLSLMGIHFVGFPAAGAFVRVPAAAAAPFVKLVAVAIMVALFIFIAPPTRINSLPPGSVPTMTPPLKLAPVPISIFVTDVPDRVNFSAFCTLPTNPSSIVPKINVWLLAPG